MRASVGKSTIRPMGASEDTKQAREDCKLSLGAPHPAHDRQLVVNQNLLNF